MVARILFDCL